MKKKILKLKLKEKVNKNRYKHCLRVAKIAKKTAKKRDLESNIAYISGLLHDYAKGLNEEESFEILTTYYGFRLFNGEKISAYHGYTAAVLVVKDLNIQDERILNAIKYHVFGDKEMDEYAKIIYCADAIDIRPYLSKNKEKIKRKKDIENLMIRNLNAACLECINIKIKNIKEINKKTYELRKKLLYEVENGKN